MIFPATNLHLRPSRPRLIFLLFMDPRSIKKRIFRYAPMDFREFNLHFECISTGISPFLKDSGDSDGEMPPLVLRAGALVRIRGLQKVGKIREFHERKKGDFTKNIYRLLGGFKHDFIFQNLWDVILPIDELHHFSRWLKHFETTNQSGFHGDLN